MNDTPVKRPPDEIVGKIAPGLIAAPMMLLADENVNKATAGQIFALITRSVTRSKTDPITGEVTQLHGLGGQVVAIPADETKARKLSSILYLPEGLMGGMLDEIKAAEKENKPDFVIQVALELFVTRAKNAAGYSWGARRMIEEPVDLENPMQKFMHMVTSKPAAQLEGPKVEATIPEENSDPTPDPAPVEKAKAKA